MHRRAKQARGKGGLVINHAPSSCDTIVHMKNELCDAGGGGVVKLTHGLPLAAISPMA